MMTAMELDARKARFIREVLTEVNDIDLLDKLSTYLRKNLKKKQREAPCQYSLEEVKQLLKQSEERFSNGEYVSNEEAIKEIQEWL